MTVSESTYCKLVENGNEFQSETLPDFHSRNSVLKFWASTTQDLAIVWRAIQDFPTEFYSHFEFQSSSQEGSRSWAGIFVDELNPPLED